MINRRNFLSFLALSGITPNALGGILDANMIEPWRSLSKSLWVWRTPLSQAQEVANFATQWGFETLYYSIPPQDRPSLYAGTHDALHAMSVLHANGRRLYVVAGNPEWCNRFKGIQKGADIPHSIQQLLEFSIRYNVLDGLCLDVEPQSLPRWQEDRPALLEGYVQLLAAIRSQLQSPLSLYATIIPAYANAHIATVSLSNRMMDSIRAIGQITDGMILMAYRSQPKQALHMANRSIKILEDIGKPWWFGVTVGAHAGPSIGYAWRGRINFLRETTDLSRALHNHHGYAGLAVQDYQGLQNILHGQGYQHAF